MLRKRLIMVIIALASIVMLASMSACGSDDAAEDSSQAEPVSNTISTPQGNLTITSISIEPHKNNPEMSWVYVKMEPEDNTPASAEAIYDGVEREAILIRIAGEEEKSAVSISQSGSAVQVGFIIPNTAEEYTMLWPDNEPIQLQDLANK